MNEAPKPRPLKPITPSIYHRGEIWFVEESPDKEPTGTEMWANRPAIIVSNNISNARSGFVQVIYMTTSTNKRTGPTHVDLGTPLRDGRQTMAMCEQIHTVDTSRLVKKLARLNDEQMLDISAGIAFSLNLDKANIGAYFRKWENHIKTHGIDMAEEIAALSAKTADQRVEVLTKALRLTTKQLSAYRLLEQTDDEVQDVLAKVSEVLDSQEENHDAA